MRHVLGILFFCISLLAHSAYGALDHGGMPKSCESKLATESENLNANIKAQVSKLLDGNPNHLDARVRAAIVPYIDFIIESTVLLRKSSSLRNIQAGDDVLTENVCGISTWIVEFVLSRAGFKTQRLVSNAQSDFFDTHVFIVVLEGKERVIVDPSWLQFSRYFWLEKVNYEDLKNEYVAVFNLDRKDKFLDLLMSFREARLSEWRARGRNPEKLAKFHTPFRVSADELRSRFDSLWRLSGVGIFEEKDKPFSEAIQEFGSQTRLAEIVRRHGL